MGCERHLARGVRFNAEKKQIGKYYSTPILSFRMKCPSCSNWIEIQTDPKNSEYQVITGAKRKNEEFTAEDNEICGTRLSAEDSEKLVNNPFFLLEHESRDIRRAKEQLPRLKSLQQSKDSIYADDWTASQQARKSFRDRKRREDESAKIEEEFRKKGGGGLNIKLVEEDLGDKAVAEGIDFSVEFRRFQGMKRELSGKGGRLEGLEIDPKTEKLKTIIKPKR